jgi:hypothetical protein
MDYIKRTLAKLFMTSEEKEAYDYERLRKAFSKYYVRGIDPDDTMERLINSMPNKKDDETMLQYVRRTNFLDLYPENRPPQQASRNHHDCCRSSGVGDMAMMSSMIMLSRM